MLIDLGDRNAMSEDEAEGIKSGGINWSHEIQKHTSQKLSPAYKRPNKRQNNGLQLNMRRTALKIATGRLKDLTGDEIKLRKELGVSVSFILVRTSDLPFIGLRP